MNDEQKKKKAEAEQKAAVLKIRRIAVEEGIVRRRGEGKQKLSKTHVGLCKNEGCWNERAPSSAHCKPCSDEHKRRVEFNAACEKAGVCQK